MVVELSEESAVASVDSSSRCPSIDDMESLAHLMVDAYRGTIDDQGEGIDDARAEIRRVFEGAYGPFLATSSDVVERDGAIVAATLVTRWQGSPFVAFAMTAPAWKRSGLARASLQRCMQHLVAAGLHRLALVVTCGNAPAERLYETMGFEEHAS